MWSPPPESNRRPHPYHGCALPTELGGREPIVAGQRLFPCFRYGRALATRQQSSGSHRLVACFPVRLPGGSVHDPSRSPPARHGLHIRGIALLTSANAMVHRPAGPLRREVEPEIWLLRIGGRRQSKSCQQMFSRISWPGGNRMCRRSSAMPYLRWCSRSAIQAATSASTASRSAPALRQ
jgi:hypothetical protein